MEIKSYDVLINEINELGFISGLNIDEYVILSNELLENLEKINQIDIKKLYNMRHIDNYKIILLQINKYKQNEDYIRNLNKILKEKQKQLSYTLQYQRNKKLKMQMNKKSIYSNK